MTPARTDSVSLHPSQARYQSFKQKLIGDTGLAYYQTRDDRLIGALQKRLTATGCRTLDSYRNLLTCPGTGRQEYHQLIDQLTIGETYFFRGEEQFRALRDHILPECAARRKDQRIIRIWSAGCSIGAEAYSLAILLGDEFAPRLQGWTLELHATDINPYFLQQAHSGRFNRWTLRTLRDSDRQQFFQQEGQDTWLLAERYRRAVRFSVHNLAADPFRGPVPTGDFDIILCRNVLLYFDDSTVRRILSGFRHSLTPGGWVLFGASDPTGAVREFLSPALPTAVFAYRRLVVSSPAEPTQPAPRAAHHPPPPLPTATEHTGDDVVADTGTPSPAASRIPMTQLRFLVDSGDWDDAAAICGTLLTIHDQDPELRVLHGLILEHQGNQRDAQKAYSQAVYLDRLQGIAWYHLGRMQVHHGETQQALKSFRNARSAIDAWEADPTPWPWEIPPQRLRDMADIQIAARSLKHD